MVITGEDTGLARVQIGRAKTMREQLGQGRDQARLAVQIGQNDFQRGREFKHELATDAAGRAGAARYDCDGRELLVAFADGFDEGRALGANCRRVAGVFDIAAGEDLAICGQQRRADAVIAVGDIGALAAFQMASSTSWRSLIALIRVSYLPWAEIFSLSMKPPFAALPGSAASGAIARSLTLRMRCPSMDRTVMLRISVSIVSLARGTRPSVK